MKNSKKVDTPLTSLHLLQDMISPRQVEADGDSKVLEQQNNINLGTVDGDWRLCIRWGTKEGEDHPLILRWAEQQIVLTPPGAQRRNCLSVGTSILPISTVSSAYFKMYSDGAEVRSSSV